MNNSMFDTHEGIELCICFGDGLAQDPDGEFIYDDVCPACQGYARDIPDWIKNLFEEMHNARDQDLR